MKISVQSARVTYVVALLLVWGAIGMIENKHRNPGKRATEVIERDVRDLPSFSETCGKVKLLLTGAGEKGDFAPIESYLVDINKAEPHYHEETTEFYYVISGSGRLEVKDKDGSHRRSFALSPGTGAVIPPNLYHQGIEGRQGMKAIVTCLPKRLVHYSGAAQAYSMKTNGAASSNVPSEMQVKQVDTERQIPKSPKAKFYFVLNGRGVLLVDGKSVDLRPGKSIYVPSGKDQTFRPNPNAPLKFLTVSMDSMNPTLGIMPSAYSQGDIHLESGGVGGIKDTSLSKK
jgi:mannose-6-phosphate isomerase-like protein (cupin superfamily)